MLKIFAQVDFAIYRETYKGWIINPRTICNYELVFITEGFGKIMIEDKIYDAKKNDIFCFYPNQKHSFSIENEPFMKFYAVHFSFNDISQKLNLPNNFKIKGNIKIILLLKELIFIRNKKEYYFEWKQDLLFSEILYIIIKLLNEDYSLSNQNILNLIEYIHNNPFYPYTIESLSQIANMKKSNLIKKFKSQTGYTPIDYCIYIKLENSKFFLTESSLSVKKIANKCGFEDEFYFSRIFKKKYGISPTKFRN